MMKFSTTAIVFCLLPFAFRGIGISLATAEAPSRPPNIVLIFTDDQGYGDVGVFGAQGFETPNLDRMAEEGMRFTDFHVAEAICGASRAALLTGCYPQRIGMFGAPGPKSKHGIHEKEALIPEVLKLKNYATAIFGKWHLGDHPRFLPTRHGFDEYFGLPYSNDMWVYHPTNGSRYPKLPLLEGEKVVEYNPDQNKLTTHYTERAVKFIHKHQDQPFFLYVPHNMPHVPLHVSEKFRGKSEQGLYGDVIMEIDWSVGQILKALKETGNDARTLVIFTTDNGPWLGYGNHAGSAGNLREGKATTWEGGQRVPCIMRWPGHVPADSVCEELCTTMDLLPTFAGLAGIEIPQGLPKPRAEEAPSEKPKNEPTAVTAETLFQCAIDGHDIRPLILGEPGAKTPYLAFYYYRYRGLEGVRCGHWKLLFPHEYRSLTGTPGKDGMPGGYTTEKIELSLYDLSQDPSERRNLLKERPDIVVQLQALAEIAREDLGDSLTDREGTGIREPGRLKQFGP